MNYKSLSNKKINLLFLTLSLVLMAAGKLSQATVPLVTAPPGSTLIFSAEASGVQIYGCEAKDKSFVWAFKAPQADLFDQYKKKIGSHSAGPTWKLNDGSSVVGELVTKVDSGEADAIPWLLVKSKSHDGAGKLAAVDFIIRSDTKNGKAPQEGCDLSHVSKEVSISYKAIYKFYSGPK